MLSDCDPAGLTRINGATLAETPRRHAHSHRIAHSLPTHCPISMPRRPTGVETKRRNVPVDELAMVPKNDLLRTNPVKFPSEHETRLEPSGWLFFALVIVLAVFAWIATAV